MTDRQPFTRPQWVDLIVLIVLVWAQVIVSLTWGDGHPLAVLLLGLVVFAMIIKVARWLIPLALEQRRGQR